MGEGAGQDELLFPFISSCSIACGGHTGDAESMKRTIELALKNDVQIGAHPSYPDRENFGRVKMEIANEALFESIAEQYQNLIEVARKEGAKVQYLKLHGALYNVLNQDAMLSEHCLPFLRDLGVTKLLGLPNSILQELTSKTDISFIPEGFADRAYTREGQLLSRKKLGALIEDPIMAAEQVRNMILNETVQSIDGHPVAMSVQTICIHSDTPSSGEIAQNLAQMFEREKIVRSAF